MAPKRKSTPSRNPLRPGTSSSDPTLTHIRFRDGKAHQDFLENFSKHGIHSKRHVVLSNFSNTALPTIIHSQGYESLCEIPVRCPTVIIQEFYSNMHGIDTFIPQFTMHIKGTSIVVTPDIISEILHVQRVSHPNYPVCPRLRTMSNDELLSLFCETPFSWGKHQNTSCSGFAKGPRFLNMVMTFVPHPLSHYNSITKPRARFLLSLIEDHSIDFSSHFILSLIGVYKDMAARNKLIFPLAIMRIIRHFSISIPNSHLFTIISAISMVSIQRSEAQLQPKQPQTETTTPPAPSIPSTFASSSSSSDVTLEAVMAQLERMDVRLDTLTTDLYQVNTRVSHITRQQAHMGGFATSPSPSPSPEAFEGC